MINVMSMILKVALCLAVICSTLSNPAEASSTPSIADMLQSGVSSTTEAPYDPLRFLLLCAPGSDRRNTCEKCTKVTRDPNSYKMCCENTRGVLRWCRTFLDYTLPPRVVGVF